MTPPKHVHTELIKLNGVEFHDQQLAIKKAKSKPEDDKENKQNKEWKGRQNNRRGRRGDFRGKGQFAKPKSRFATQLSKRINFFIW